MASNDDNTMKKTDSKEVEEDEDKVYEMLQTSASLLDKAASHNERMMHSFGGSMDLEFAVGEDSDDDDDDDDPSSNDKGEEGK